MIEPESRMLAVQLDNETVNLDLRIYKPEGEGPFPTLIFNHGSTGCGTFPASFKNPVRFTEIANFFVSRGWVVLAPARRGRAGSEGVYNEGFNTIRSLGYSFETERSLEGAERALQDIESVMEKIPSLTYVDSKRLLIGGESRGGILSIAYAGRNENRVLGVINFVGGWIGTGLSTSEEINQTIFEWGGNFTKETLWLYGNNDSYYPLTHSRQNFEAFQKAGGQGSWYELAPPARCDGHSICLFPSLWSGEVEQYLERLGLPAKEDTTTERFFEWPGFQDSLLPAESSSPVKAELPNEAFNFIQPEYISKYERAVGIIRSAPLAPYSGTVLLFRLVDFYAA